MTLLSLKKRIAKPSVGYFASDLSYDRSYFAHEAIDHYASDLGGPPKKLVKKYSYGATGTGPTAAMTLERSTSDAGYLEKVRWLCGELAKHNVLTDQRPRKMLRHDQTHLFVFEKTEARCFTIPSSHLPLTLKAAAFRVWVSNPDPAHFSDKPFEWTGSYLFLTEIHLDNVGYHHIYSGCSALRMIFNAVAGKKATERDGEEVYGRYDERSVTAKLIQMGAVPSGRYMLETLYRVRYITDEQWHSLCADGRRVHDILGYPLYIRSRPLS